MSHVRQSDTPIPKQGGRGKDGLVASLNCWHQVRMLQSMVRELQTKLQDRDQEVEQLQVTTTSRIVDVSGFMWCFPGTD